MTTTRNKYRETTSAPPPRTEKHGLQISSYFWAGLNQTGPKFGFELAGNLAAVMAAVAGRRVGWGRAKQGRDRRAPWEVDTPERPTRRRS